MLFISNCEHVEMYVLAHQIEIITGSATKEFINKQNSWSQAKYWPTDEMIILSYLL